MSKMKQSHCLHVTTDAFTGFSEILDQISSNQSNAIRTLFADSQCYECKANRRYLWLCLHKNCNLVLCGEGHKDHSTTHYQEEEKHCLQLNLQTLRIWCYLCSSEVFPSNNDPPMDNSISLLLTQDSSLFPTSYELNKPHGIIGLQNLGNTCYMNAALQALSSIPPMTQFFLDCMMAHDKDKETKKMSLAKAYANLVQDLWCNTTATSVIPSAVLYAVKLAFPMFRGFQQHDSQEFLRCFMDQLHEELKEPVNEKQKVDSQTGDSKSDSESEQSESESYLTCDSGVSDDSESIDEERELPVQKRSRKRHRSLSENEFSDAMDRLPTPRNSEATAESVKCRSIVSDIFDGQILSSVQCLTCNRISSRVETFQDLSLPIPNKDQLNVLHQSVTKTSPQRESQGWILWMWSVVWGWLWGPTVDLNDCLAAFFSADELKGDNMYSCEKCKKLRNGSKYSLIIELPEVLTIHLKRFRHEPLFSTKISSHIAFPIQGLDMKLWVTHDCTSRVTTYDLVAVIVHHGTAGGGHYTCFGFNEPTQEWYEFDDSFVRPVSVETVANCQAYVLFYRKSSKEMDNFRRYVESVNDPGHNLQSGGGLLQFYISQQWFSKFTTFAEPGPIHNNDFLCPHGGVQPLKMDKVKEVCIPVNALVWEQLYSRFGGGPACNRLYSCPVCQHEQELLDKRRAEELEEFMKLKNEFQNEKIPITVYAIAMNWFRKWESFVRNREVLVPGPVDNIPITVLRNGVRVLKAASDYAQLSPALWQFFHQRYGGGPEVILHC